MPLARWVTQPAREKRNNRRKCPPVLSGADPIPNNDELFPNFMGLRRIYYLHYIILLRLEVV